MELFGGGIAAVLAGVILLLMIVVLIPWQILLLALVALFIVPAIRAIGVYLKFGRG